MKSLKLDDLKELLKKLDSRITKVTGRSINDVPEYYINVVVGELLQKEGYGVEFEMPTQKLCDSLNIPKELMEECKLSDKKLRSGNIDLVIKTGKTGSIKHLLEVKRTSLVKYLKPDVDRILLYSKNSEKRSVQKGFIVFITGRNEVKVGEHLQKIAKEADCIITYDFIESGKSNTREYRGKVKDEQVRLWCCEIKPA